jgi:hypothetical protein
LSDNKNPKENSSSTPLSKRAEILGELWIRYKSNPDFEDFVQYNDLGLPLAYSLSSGIISTTPKAEAFINETWEILMSAMDFEDIGFDNLDEILDSSIPDMGLLNNDE